LRTAYGDDEIPDHHLPHLGRQIEAQFADYEAHEEEIEIAVALVKPEGFDRRMENGQPIYTARIGFAPNRAELYKTAADTVDAAFARTASFHYDGYNFDSAPEAEFLDWALALVKANADAVEGLWFTGGLTSPDKTELLAEYLGEDGRWHHYTPDFVIRRADGKTLVVEIKSDAESPDIAADLARHAKGEAPQTREGRKVVALKRWEDLNPDWLAYHVMFANGTLHDKDKKTVKDFIAGGKPS
jgi:hypothetical protein